MRKSIGILLTFTSVMLLVGCMNGSTVNTSLGTEFTLAIEQTASISSENLSIKFVDVTADSRCPSDVECPWAGEVKILLDIKNNGSLQRVELSQLGAGNNEGQKFGDYYYKFKVEPYPVSTHEIKKSEYRLIMTVTKMP
jgi:hypothetical protein